MHSSAVLNSLYHGHHDATTGKRYVERQVLSQKHRATIGLRLSEALWRLEGLNSLLPELYGIAYAAEHVEQTLGSLPAIQAWTPSDLVTKSA